MVFQKQIDLFHKRPPVSYTLMGHDEFEDKMAAISTFQQQLEDLSWCGEYTGALDNCVGAYFFMRGVEGYLAGRHSPPIYKGMTWARNNWQKGHDAAEWYFRHIEGYDPYSGAMCRAFLRGFVDEYSSDDFESQVFGVMFRVGFECKEAGQVYSRFFKYSDEPKEEIETMGQLYRVEGTKKMGTRVGEDSDGSIILKIKDVFEAFPAEKVKKVMPHTVRFQGGGSFDRHYKCPKTKFRQGDIVVTKTSGGLHLMEVTEVDSECENASDLPSGFFKGFVIKQPRTTKKKA